MATLAEDVEYVRLPDRLLAGNVTDVNGGSGWGISGLDVKEMPDATDEPEANQFVVTQLRAGYLEEATAAEHSMVRDVHAAVEKVAKLSLPTEFGGPAKPSPWNEAAIDNVAKRNRRKLMAARLTNNFPDRRAAEAAGEEADGDGYMSQHKAELANLARARELDDSGTKKDLAARLEAWDNEHPDGNK